MSVQSEIDRIITAVGNAYSKVSEKGGTVPASQTVANLATAIDSIPSSGAKETWVIKSEAAGEFATTQIAFTSNGQKFTSIGAVYDGSVFSLIYGNNEIAINPGVGGGYEFYNEAYRKLTFDTPPTGALLTWLQANGIKQPDDTAVQNTKALTITSNGTVSVTPDAPYDALKKVDVTVNVSGGGGVENEGCNVVTQGHLPLGSFVALTDFSRMPGVGVEITPVLIYIDYEDPGDNGTTELTVLKNSPLFIGGITGNCVAEGSIVAGNASNDGYYAFWVTGDCKITF